MDSNHYRESTPLVSTSNVVGIKKFPGKILNKNQKPYHDDVRIPKNGQKCRSFIFSTRKSKNNYMGLCRSIPVDFCMGLEGEEGLVETINMMIFMSRKNLKSSKCTNSPLNTYT